MGAQDQRPRFYEGQYLGAEDLAAIVEYLRAADARHVLGAHAWGIAVGLHLTEKPSPGAPDRVEVALQPGVAWDGFARALVVAQPTRLPESLFQEIEPDPARDDPALPGGPAGRLVKVWLNYKELGARQPAPGFETCLTDDQSSRVRESFEFLVGDFAEGVQQRANVAVGPLSVDPREALTRFDAKAPTLWDESVAQQSFPFDTPPRRWLVPIGKVRWVARAGGLGYFLKRDKFDAAKVEAEIRALRRHIGAVAEYIHSAANAIVLHRRGEQHDKAFEETDGLKRKFGRFGALRGGGPATEELEKDLVWVEGNLRVEGDAKLAGGQLHFRDGNGLERKTPLYVERVGDAGGGDGNRQLRVALGPATQADNRFVVGRQAAGAPPPGEPPALDPSFVVVSNGDVGIGTSAPDGRVTIQGKVQPQQGRLTLFSATADVEYDGGSDKLFIFKDTGGTTAFMGTKLGVGTAQPRNPLAVRGTGTAEELVSFEAADGATKWHINQKLGGDKPGLNFAETGVADARLFLEAGGDVGVGTPTPSGRLTLEGKVQPQQGSLTFFSATADMEYDGGNDELFIFQQTVPGVTSFMNARLGVGTTNPRNALAVRGVRTGEELLSFETPAGVTKWHINQALAGSPRGLNFVETGVADGRLYLREGGNVGIGTTDPAAKLHVAGSFLRVDGLGGEQAYIGGDGSVNVFGRDVQIGSTRANLTEVHLWNRADGDWMWLTCMGVDVASDARRKTNIEPLSGALEQVCRLRGVRFEWKRPPESEFPPRRGLGVLAQEVADVAPELVKSVRGNLTVSYNELVPLLIEAVKELKAEVDELRARLPKAKAPKSKKGKRPRDRH